MTSVAPSDEIQEPFPQSGLGALLSAAATDLPDAVLIRDDEGASSAATLARRVRVAADALRQAGLARGERVLIVAGAQTSSVVALVAALRAGLEPALVACGIGPIELAAYASAAKAVALIGPARYGSLHLDNTYLSAAALAKGVRLVASLGPEPVDGAIDLSAAALDAMAENAGSAAQTASTARYFTAEAETGSGPESTEIATFEGPVTAPRLVSHRQAALFADALSLVEQARINPSMRIVSTLPPASLAGLVAGPFAALIGASSLVLHGPFDARGLLAACDAEPGFHLVVPGALGALFEDARLSGDATSLILVSRFANTAGFVLPAPLAVERPLVDLYAFGETTLLAQRRADGNALPPARVADRSRDGGLGARLNRARAEHRLHRSERS